MVIEDKEYVDSYMNGKPWKAGKFSLSLRVSLWAEHLGLRMGEVSTLYFSHFHCAFFILIKCCIVHVFTGTIIFNVFVYPMVCRSVKSVILWPMPPIKISGWQLLR